MLGCASLLTQPVRKRLTKRTVNSIRPADQTFVVWDTDVTGFGLKVTPAGRKIYVFQYRLPGRGRSSSSRRITIARTGDVPLDKAQKIAAQHLLDVKAGGDPALIRKRGGVPTVAGLADVFLHEYLPAKKRPPRASTLGDYASLLSCHVVPRLGKKRVDEVTSADIEQLHTGMRSKPYVANRTLSFLQQAFDQAERWGWRPQLTNPVRHIERYREARRGARKEVMLTPEQMRDLLEAIDVEEATGERSTGWNAIRLAFWTGWRISEVLGLKWDNIDLDNATAKIEWTKTAEEEYRRIPDEAVDVMRQQEPIAGSPYVFPSKDPRKSLGSVRKPWLRVIRRAGLDDMDGLGRLRLHDLRHNVVSWDVSRGVPLEIAGRNIGHRSRQATEIYAHFAPDALRQAADDRAQAMRRAVEEAKYGSKEKGKKA